MVLSNYVFVYVCVTMMYVYNMYVCMYVCMYVYNMYVCMYIYVHVYNYVNFMLSFICQKIYNIFKKSKKTTHDKNKNY